MKHPSQEDLLGYVLGALDAQEHRKLQQLIENDPELESQFLEIKSALSPLDYIDGEQDDVGGRRAGLARRTCEMVSAYKKQADIDRALERAEETDSQRELSLLMELESASLAADALNTSKVALAEKSDSESSFAMSSASWLGRATNPSSWSLSDLLVGVMLCGILAAILLPAVSYTRYNSRVVSCQDNLRALGAAFWDYSDIHGGSFIAIPESGNLATTGCYGPVLKDCGLLPDDNLLRCDGTQNDLPVHIPTCDQVETALGHELLTLRRKMGGDYGYTLGYLEGERRCTPRNQGREHFILLADMPSSTLEGRQSSNHEGYGQNCLFESGAVLFISAPVIGTDSIFVNDNGIVAPGSHANDNVVAPSFLEPSSSYSN